MSRLLLEEEPLVVLPKLATVIGLNEAIILQQLHYWLEKSNNVKDGFGWIYNTYEEWKNQFPFWSESTIKRTLKKLQEQKIIIVGNYNKLKIDHTKWYRIDYEVLDNIEQEAASQSDLASGQNDQTKRSNCPDEQVKMTRPIPETTTEITTENVYSSNSAFAFYENNFGVLNSFMADSIDRWIRDVGEELVIAAMERALKRQAKWNYAEGILKQWINSNIRTLSDVRASEEAFKRQKQSKREREIRKEAQVMEVLSEVMTKILNTSACNDNDEGYECPECHTFVRAIVVEVKALNIKRKVFPTCECVVVKEEAKIREAQNFAKKREIDKLFSISNLGERFKKSTFEAFRERTGAVTASQVAQKYVNEFKEWNGESLMIWGEPGNGKTHLAASIANELSKQGYIVVFQSVPELLQRIRSTFNSDNKESETQIMRALLECDLLILDDIGAEKATEWVEEKLFSIIDGRYRKEAPTLYTSNLQPKSLQHQIGKRSYDRIVETNLTVENQAKSYRREIAKQRLQAFGG